MRNIQLSSGKTVCVIDDVFNFQDIHDMEMFCENSYYKIGATSSDFISDGQYTFMQSVFSDEDLDNFGFFRRSVVNDFKTLLNGKKLFKCWALSITKTDKFFYHTDAIDKSGVLTLIYFVNRKWDRDWGGEMLFASDSGDAEAAVTFKPGRVIVFDSTIPHKPTPNAIDSPQYAYMFVAQFNNG
jgi:Rps23 Pro-64 3,4-dihydroxylase Tpa1-like proline 4-hydroxylase